MLISVIKHRIYYLVLVLHLIEVERFFGNNACFEVYPKARSRLSVVIYLIMPKVMQTQDLHGHRWEVNNFSNTVWEAAIWMHHFFQVVVLLF